MQRFNVQTQTLLAPFNVGILVGAAPSRPTGTGCTWPTRAVPVRRPTIHKVNLTTGAVTNISMPISFPEIGALDVKITSSSTAFVTADDAFTGNWDYLRQLNLTAGTLTTRGALPAAGGPGFVQVGTRMYRGADRSQLLLIQPGEDWSQPLIQLEPGHLRIHGLPGHLSRRGLRGGQRQRFAGGDGRRLIARRHLRLR